MYERMSRYGVGWLCAMAVILSLCSVKSARADSVAFSNLGSPISFSTSTGWEVIPGANVATEFTPSADVAVSQIDVGIGNITGLPTGISNGVNFAVYTNVGGSPGSVFGSFPELTSFTDFGSGQCAGLACTVQTLKPVGSLDLQGGVPYWLVASAGGAGTDAVWNGSNILDGGVKINQGGGLWMSSVDNFAGAFDVVGTVTDSVSGEAPCLNRRGLSYWPSDCAHYAQSKYEKPIFNHARIRSGRRTVAALRV